MTIKRKNIDDVGLLVMEIHRFCGLNECGRFNEDRDFFAYELPVSLMPMPFCI